MFYHQKDWSQGEILACHTQDSSGVITASYLGASSARYTRSWRSKKPSGSFDPKGSTFGIRPPRSKGSVVDILADRKRYIEEVAQTAAGARENGNTIPGLSKCYPTLDTGHTFTSVKWSTRPAFVEQWNSNQGKSYLAFRGDVCSNGLAFLPQGVAVPSDFPTGSSLPSGVSAPSALLRQDKINLMFHQMNPSKRRAQIGETIISLMRGDVPTILKNVRKTIKDVKKSYKHQGSEYLNYQFGWLPIIDDIRNAIGVLAHVDALVFDGANRRKRDYPWPTSIATSTNAAVRASRYNLGGASPADAQLGVRGTQTIKYTVSCDVRLSARLTPITRRTIAETDFVSQVGDKLSQLGMWYPALGWDLLPYSWMVDWAVNIGRALENSLTYGSKPGQQNVDYAWATTKFVLMSTQTYQPYLSGATRFMPLQPLCTELTVVKDRIQGTPFGFGVSFDGLNAWQMSILVALGLAKTR